MVLVIAFLTISNIALGYGLAIYVNRHFGTLLLTRSKSQAVAKQMIVDSPSAKQLAEELPAVPPTAMSTVQDQVVVEAQPVAAKAPTAESVVSEPVDEENVLAGIEEFRSQLAKMNTPFDQPTEAASAPEVELAAAN